MNKGIAIVGAGIILAGVLLLVKPAQGEEGDGGDGGDGSNGGAGCVTLAPGTHTMTYVGIPDVVFNIFGESISDILGVEYRNESTGLFVEVTDPYTQILLTNMVCRIEVIRTTEVCGFV